MRKKSRRAGQPAFKFKFSIELSWATIKGLFQIGRWPTEIFIIIAVALWGSDRAEILKGLLGSFLL